MNNQNFVDDCMELDNIEEALYNYQATKPACTLADLRRAGYKADAAWARSKKLSRQAVTYFNKDAR